MPRCGDKSCTRCNNAPGEDRYSMSIYAGHMCDPCWDTSGDKKVGREAFDPGYAGEHYDEDEAY